MASDSAYELAQLNIARPIAPLTSELLVEFVALLDPVNALADRAAGFIWRLQTEDGDATAVRGFGDDELIVNMSTWRSLPALADFVFGSFHVEVMRRRREWFARMHDPSLCCGGFLPGTDRPSPRPRSGSAPCALRDRPAMRSPSAGHSALPTSLTK